MKVDCEPEVPASISRFCLPVGSTNVTFTGIAGTTTTHWFDAMIDKDPFADTEVNESTEDAPPTLKEICAPAATGDSELVKGAPADASDISPDAFIGLKLAVMAAPELDSPTNPAANTGLHITSVAEHVNPIDPDALTGVKAVGEGDARLLMPTLPDPDTGVKAVDAELPSPAKLIDPAAEMGFRLF